MNTCSHIYADGHRCDRPRANRLRLCSAHRSRKAKGRDMDAPIQERQKWKGQTCKRCLRPVKAKGLCKSHHRHWRRYGRTEPLRPTRPVGTTFRVDGVRFDKKFKRQLDYLSEARGLSVQRVIMEIVETVLSFRVQGMKALVPDEGLEATAWCRREDVLEAA